LVGVSMMTAGRVLFGAAECGKTPSPAMISAFLDVFNQQEHMPLIPIVRTFT
jgi:non-heme chloroperoxidase